MSVETLILLVILLLIVGLGSALIGIALTWLVYHELKEIARRVEAVERSAGRFKYKDIELLETVSAHAARARYEHDIAGAFLDNLQNAVGAVRGLVGDDK